MIPIKSYSKITRMQLATLHTAAMEREYPNEIAEAINQTTHYTDQDMREVTSKGYNTSFVLTSRDSVSELLHLKPNDHIGILNFASYKNPGGRFDDGSSAQEEFLCHHSFLYNVLLAFKESYYEPHMKTLNKALYINELLFTKNIPFFNYSGNVSSWDIAHTEVEAQKDLFKIEYQRNANVITCAAPNKTAAQKYQHVKDDVMLTVMKARIDFLLNIAYQNDCEILILGAFGCGVFGNDATEVATIFYELLHEKYEGCFKHIHFAVPIGTKDENFQKFKKVFSEREYHG